MSFNLHQKEFILNENLTKVMTQLSMPAIIAMVLFGLNAFMDTVYIGQLMNETALAGVALAYPLASIAMGIGSWAGTGAGNLLSIALGKKDVETQRKILSNSTIIMLVLSLVFTIPAYIFADELIALMGGTGEVKQYAVDYFKVTMIGTPIWVYGLGLNLVVRGEGKMKESAIMMSYGLILNLILTPIFIQYLNMGIVGAAWATNVGMLVYSIVGYIYFVGKGPSFEANINSLKYDKKVFKSILQMGFPGFIMSFMGLIQAFVTLNAISNYGTELDLAFFASANRILLFLMTPLFGLMRALQPVVGINYGAHNYQRVKDSFVLFTKTGTLIIFPFWLLLSIFPHESLHLMLPSLEISAENIFYFRIYMLVLLVLPLVFMALTYFPAIEQPKVASITGVARQLIFYVPAMIFLPKWFGIGGIYYGSTAIDILLTVVIGYYSYLSFKQLSQKQKERQQKEIPVLEEL